MQIRICHLSEGVAGHDGQVLGVIKTLRDAGYDISVNTVHITWKIYALRGLLRLFSRKLSRYPNYISIRLIRFCYKCPLIDNVDIIISGGANLAPLNIALSKILEIKNIHLSSPRDWRVSDFSAYITSTKVSESPANIVPKIVPNQFDPQKCKELGIKFISENRIERINFSLLILGGNGIGYTYTNNEWHNLVENFSSFCRSKKTKPLFITSRRTPKEIEDLIKEKYDVSMSVLFHSENTRGKFDHLLYIADNIFVTEDSSTMLSEAISSGKKVISIYPQNINAPDKYLEIITKYEGLGFIERCKITNIKEFSLSGEINIQEKVDSYRKNFQRLLIDRLKD